MTLQILPITNRLMTIMEGINKAIGSAAVSGFTPSKPSTNTNPPNPLQMNLKPKTSSTQRPQTQNPKTQIAPSPKQ